MDALIVHSVQVIFILLCSIIQLLLIPLKFSRDILTVSLQLSTLLQLIVLSSTIASQLFQLKIQLQLLVQVHLTANLAQQIHQPAKYANMVIFYPLKQINVRVISNTLNPIQVAHQTVGAVPNLHRFVISVSMGMSLVQMIISAIRHAHHRHNILSSVLIQRI